MAGNQLRADDWIVHADAPRRLWLGALASFLVGGTLFMLDPRIDLAVSGLFFDSHRGVFLGESTLLEALRNVFKAVYIVALAVAVIGFVACQFIVRRFLGLDPVKWLFLCLCLVTGPGLVANLAFKDQWGRARPRHVVEFGGDKAFTPALAPSKQCDRNCSFVSGEASSIYMVFFAAGCLFPRRGRQLIVAGLAIGSIAGLIRMSQGGHFLSDVIFAGIAMAVTATALHRLFFVVATSAPGRNPVASANDTRAFEEAPVPVQGA